MQGIYRKSLAGDPSEVTALGVRHWITSFRWLWEPQYSSESAAVKALGTKRVCRTEPCIAVEAASLPC
jgi:hypothetical protein